MLMRTPKIISVALVMVLVAKALGFVLKRREDYYDDGERDV